MKRGLLLLAGLLLAGCSEDGGGNNSNDSGPEACDHKLVDGTCVGVTRPEICEDAFCTGGGAACSRVWHVKRDAGGDGSRSSPMGSLADAAARASAGECIALGQGSYDGAQLKGGVSLLGAGAKKVTISASGQPALAVEDGSGGLIRGVTLSSTSVALRLRRMKGLRVEQVAVARAAGVGIDARGCSALELANVLVKEVALVHVPAPDAGASDAGGASGDGKQAGMSYGVGIVLAEQSTATVSASAVVKCGTQGVLVHGSDAALEGIRVADSGRFGVALSCTTASCPGSTRVERCTIDSSAGVGLLAQGGKLEAVDSDIGNTTFLQGGVGRNVQVQDGTDLLLESCRMHHSKGQGVVVDGATGKLVSNTVESNEDRGAVVQNVDGAAGLVLQDNQVLANERVGLAVLSSTTVTLQGGRIAGTKKRPTMVLSESVKVGDGLQIVDTQSVIKVSKLRLEGNERFGVLVDAAKTAIVDTTIKGGDQAVVVQDATAKLQNVTNGAGVAINPQKPAKPYLFNRDALISTLPIPLP